MDLHERAESFVELLASEGIGNRPLAFITHSLGGIVAKEMLRVSLEGLDEDWQKIGNNTKLLCFLATPHTGASIAATVKNFLPRTASSHLKLLSNESGYLTALNKAYKDLSAKHQIKTLAFYEMHKTKGVMIVDSQSADPGLTGVRPMPVEADHISICKLESRDSLVYRSLRRHLQKLGDLVPATALVVSFGETSAFAAQDYSFSSEGDRRDLLQKLIDAGREHEYQNANGLQSRFAQNYYRLGLHTEAKRQHDNILSEVQQRFIAHVYHEKICKDASNEGILDALQDAVIDKICAKYANGTAVTSTAVLEALYFLTEKCHIRWDKP